MTDCPRDPNPPTTIRSSPPDPYHEDRPWGSFDKFVDNEVCSVKIITVRAAQKLSLQSHRQRSEWWIVLDGEMLVEVDGRQELKKAGERAFIPVQARHRAVGLELDCRWLEISYGHFDENDIERFDDIYGRK